MDKVKLMLNPARLRILQYFRLHGSVRTSDIVEYMSDTPRATVYHHVKILEDNKMIKVVKENRIRGAVEKVYALQENAFSMEADTSVALSTAFHIGLMQEMNDYLSSKEQDCKKDKVLFTTALLYMTDHEYDQLLEQMGDLMKPYIDKRSEPNLRMRKLSLISSPPSVKEEK